MTTARLTTASLKHAGLFETETAAEQARTSYIATARLMYGPRVCFKRAVGQPVYSGAQGGWIVPVVLLQTDKTVYLTGAEA